MKFLLLWGAAKPVAASKSVNLPYKLDDGRLLAPVAYAKTGGDANLSINTSTGVITAAVAPPSPQTITGTITGYDGCVIPFTVVVNA